MVRFRILAIGLVAVLGVSLQAHELPPEVQVFFKVQGSTVRVLARLPLATLADARLQLTQSGALDLAASRPMLAAAAADFVRNAEVKDEGALLSPGAIAWRVSNQDNLVFMLYDIADAYLRSDPGSEQAIVDPSRGFLDLRVEYPSPSPAPRLQVRVNALRIGGAFVPTRATYITGDGGVRQFFVRGAPTTVAFEPRPGAAAARFASLGAARFALERGLLLFLFVLAVAGRPFREAIVLLATTLGAYAVAAAVTLSSTSVDARLTGSAALVAAALLAVAALQNFTTVRFRWSRSVALLLGLASGVSAGAAAQEMISFAGSHWAIGAALFLMAVTAGCAAAFAAFQVLVVFFRRLPIAPHVAAILLSILPLHTALHAMAVEGGKLAGLNPPEAGGFWTTTLAYWPPLLAVFSVLVLAAIRALARGTPLEHPEAG